MTDFDTEYVDGVAVCPHCGYVHRDCWEWHDGLDGTTLEHDCEKCGKPFEVEIMIRTLYTTKKKTNPDDPSVNQDP